MRWFRITDSSTRYAEESECHNWRIRLTRYGYLLTWRTAKTLDTPVGPIAIFTAAGDYKTLGEARRGADGAAVDLDAVKNIA